MKKLYLILAMLLFSSFSFVFCGEVGSSGLTPEEIKEIAGLVKNELIPQQNMFTRTIQFVGSTCSATSTAVKVGSLMLGVGCVTWFVRTKMVTQETLHTAVREFKEDHDNIDKSHEALKRIFSLLQDASKTENELLQELNSQMQSAKKVIDGQTFAAVREDVKQLSSDINSFGKECIGLLSVFKRHLENSEKNNQRLDAVINSQEQLIEELKARHSSLLEKQSSCEQQGDDVSEVD